MRFVFLDDSIEFDGYTPAGLSLGGAEAAFASLPGALVKRGHQVQVHNRCRHQLYIDGARWLPWDEKPPMEADVLIAFRRIPLLEPVRRAKARMLWVTAHPDYLAPAKVTKHIREMEATIVFGSQTQSQLWHPEGTPPSAALIRHGVRHEYLAQGKSVESATPDTAHEMMDNWSAPLEDAHDAYVEVDEQGRSVAPRAILTTHPRHGLKGVLQQWQQVIHPAVPSACLDVYSGSLWRAQHGKGDGLPDDIRMLADYCTALKGSGVRVIKPRGAAAMAKAYRAADVHLYPGHEADVNCWTLADSQACGTPAVACRNGAVAERVVDGVSGHIAPDEAAFANLAVLYLQNRDMGGDKRQEVLKANPKRGWDVAAEEFEHLAAKLLRAKS